MRTTLNWNRVHKGLINTEISSSQTIEIFFIITIISIIFVIVIVITDFFLFHLNIFQTGTGAKPSCPDPRQYSFIVTSFR